MGDWLLTISAGDAGGPDDAGERDESFETCQAREGALMIGTILGWSGDGTCDDIVLGGGGGDGVDGICWPLERDSAGKGRGDSMTGEGMAVDKGKSGCALTTSPGLGEYGRVLDFDELEGRTKKVFTCTPRVRMSLGAV